MDLPQSLNRVSNQSLLSKNELLGYYTKFNEIAKGKTYLDLNLFQDFVNAMGLYPKKRVIEKIFKMLDTDNSNSLEFEEIILYLEVMIKGSLDDKIEFMYNFIVENEKDKSIDYDSLVKLFELQIDQ